MRLYCYPKSPWSRKVMVALAEKGLAYDRVVIDIGKGEQKTAAFLALNPRHKLPVLEDGGLVVRDSTVILEYLEDKYPERPLLPRDPVARARVRMMEDEADSYVAGPCFAAVCEKYEAFGPCDPAKLARMKADLEVEMDRWAAALGDSEWAAGSVFTVADCAFMPFIESYGWADLTWKHSNVLRYIERLKARPSWSVGQEPK